MDEIRVRLSFVCDMHAYVAIARRLQVSHEAVVKTELETVQVIQENKVFRV